MSSLDEFVTHHKRVLIWDLETSSLEADFGTLLAVGYKWLGEKTVHVLSITNTREYKRDHTNDKGLVKEFLKVYLQADMTVAYNGVLFDRPYFFAKLLEHGLEIPPSIPMQDPYFCVKSNLKISRKSLQNTAYYLSLSNEKTPVEGKIWRKAGAGHGPSIKYIVDHCRADVLVLEELYLKIRPLMRTHFRLSDDLGKCRFCNSKLLVGGKRHVTKLKNEAVRIQCQSCKSWDTRTNKEIEKFKIK